MQPVEMRAVNTPALTPPRAIMIPLALAIAVGVLAGLWAALQRLGWTMPTITQSLPSLHGPLMVGFLGTLISMERAVALSALDRARFRWTYAAPVLAGLGSVLLIPTNSALAAKALVVAGSVGLALIFAVIVHRHKAMYTVTMALGAVCWLLGNLLWFSGQPIFVVVHWWIGFLVLTIVGERLELSRVLRLTVTSQRLFGLAAAIFLAGIVLSAFVLDAGIRLAGIGELGLALWLLRFDVAKRTIRLHGLTRFMGACLFVGYIWLGIGGAMGIAFGAMYAGFLYDAFLHAILLGFVMSMIFGHAPIIFPSLTGKQMAYSALFYSHFLLLHAALIVRVVSDLNAWTPGRLWAGLLNVVAVLLFVAITIRSVFIEHRHQQHDARVTTTTHAQTTTPAL